MTSLINTKWVFNDTPALNEIVGYNINFNSNGHQYEKLTVEQAMNPNFELKYYQHGDVVDYPYHTGNSWQNEAFKTIVITGGADLKNEELFAFLSANATQERLVKNIQLEKDNIDFYPRTKASLLVEDDGKTAWKTVIDNTANPINIELTASEITDGKIILKDIISVPTAVAFTNAFDNKLPLVQPIAFTVAGLGSIRHTVTQFIGRKDDTDHLTLDFMLYDYIGLGGLDFLQISGHMWTEPDRNEGGSSQITIWLDIRQIAKPLSPAV